MPSGLISRQMVIFFWIQACYDKIENQVSHKEALKTLKKATVEEIKEHFKNGYTED